MAREIQKGGKRAMGRERGNEGRKGDGDVSEGARERVRKGSQSRPAQFEKGRVDRTDSFRHRRQFGVCAFHC